MALFYKILKNYNAMQLTKNKMDLNNQKLTNYPPFPGSLKGRPNQRDKYA